MLERLRHLNPTAKKEIRSATRRIDSVWRDDVKPLSGYPDHYTLRVGGYRVILVRVGGRETFEVENFDLREFVYENYPRPSDD